MLFWQAVWFNDFFEVCNGLLSSLKFLRACSKKQQQDVFYKKRCSEKFCTDNIGLLDPSNIFDFYELSILTKKYINQCINLTFTFSVETASKITAFLNNTWKQTQSLFLVLLPRQQPPFWKQFKQFTIYV